MKGFLRSIYHAITQPLYRRLSREMSISLQALVEAQTQFEEKFVQRLLDEVIVLSIQVEEQGRVLRSLYPECHLNELPTESLADVGLADVQIVQLIEEAGSGKELIDLATKWNISPLLAAKLRARLNGVGIHNIGVVHSLERENARLTRALAGKQTSK